MKKKLLSLLMLALGVASMSAQAPKREFRGAWLHTVHQWQYSKMTPDETRKYLIGLLDSLEMTGHNAVIFQVRPSADALYPSKLEPWSRFVTGKAGVAPSPVWDPLQFMITESHKRGMELHAWLNPYRVTTNKNEKLAPNHIYFKHPERFVTYGDKMYFDPGLPENREFIEGVVADIVTRYDVDAIHMDDYFYPYPVKGKDFPDKKSYAKYGKGMNIGDWRRENVNLLIEGLHKVIQNTKPWVRLGISPFGIWRNKKSDPRGSDTNGLQNYDELYADVILWTEKGWVDYMLPQLYWELEKEVASSEKLAYWWSDNANGRHMYIGQDVNRTMSVKDINGSTDPNQLAHKIALSRQLPNIHGNCWWPGYSVTRNFKGIADSLAPKEQNTIAIIPPYSWIDNVAPEATTGLKAVANNDKVTLSWNMPKVADALQEARAYCVYVFADGESVNTECSKAIKALVYDDAYRVDENSVQYQLKGLKKGAYTIVVTTLDRAWNESQPTAKVSVTI